MASAPSALWYLWWRSALNLVRGRLLRLRQPKYLFGAALALAYIYFAFIFPHVARSERRAARIAAGEIPAVPPDRSDEVVASAAFVMLLLFMALWLWRRARTVLQFSEAEIAWLFPGPVAHSTLIHYSLLRGQAALVFTAALMMIVTLGWNFIPSALWMRGIGWWLLFGTCALHTTASGFVITRLLNRGIAQWQRQLGVLLLLVAALWLMNVFDPHLRLPLITETASPEAFLAYAQDQVGSGALYWLLAPLRLLAQPLVAADAMSFLRALGPALAVYLLHYYWAFRSELPDHEATLASATKRANILAAMRSEGIRFTLAPRKVRRDPFTLAAQGSPVLALLWKNLLSTREYLNLRSLLVLAALIVAWNWWFSELARPGPLARIPTIIAAFIGMQTLFVGAQFARQDLRSDLDNADLIKTWPLPGWQIVFGQMLTPALILTGILWLCLLQIGLGLPAPSQGWLTPQLRSVILVSLALVLPLMCATQLLLANTAAVLFPAWMKSSQGHGWEVAGPRLVFFAAQWFAMLFALVPALLFGLLVYLPASWYVGDYALLPAAVMAALVIAGELAWGINWLGERFEAYDLSA